MGQRRKGRGQNRRSGPRRRRVLFFFFPFSSSLNAAIRKHVKHIGDFQAEAVGQKGSKAKQTTIKSITSLESINLVLLPALALLLQFLSYVSLFFESMILNSVCSK